MDISVSHLNSRLALQIPTELPLGLVFVMGKVTNLTNRDKALHQNSEKYPLSFDLVENGYILHCLLTARAADETPVANDNQIRAGGHLVFDVQQASYYLLTRDVEVVVKEPAPVEKTVGRSALTPVLADIKKRSEVAASNRTDMPVWVQRLAPPEIRAEMQIPILEREADKVEEQGNLNDDLIDFLSEAIESPEDVELTSDLLQEIAPEVSAHHPTKLAGIYEVPPAAPVQTVPISRSRTRGPDWSIILIILSILILAAALVITFLTQIG